MTSRRVLILSSSLVLAAGAALWLHANSLPRLRQEFIPWMKRLERWRDGIESVQNAVARSEGLPGDPAGADELRRAAWEGLDSIAFVTYRVEKPRHAVSAELESTTGEVRFEVGGFRSDGARVERFLPARVSVDRTGGGNLRVRVSLEGPLIQRVEPRARFQDATGQAGLGAPRNDPTVRMTNRLIEGIWPGSGVAVLDFDRDGDEDLFVGDGVRSILYANEGSGQFTDVTERAGLAVSASSGVAATGIAAGDVDGDGFPDLFVTDAFGPSRLFRNRSGGSFEDVTERSAIRVNGKTRSAAFADVDGDGDLDLFVCVTGDYYRQMPDPPFDAKDAAENHLFLNDGKGRFRDVSADRGFAGERRWTLSSLFADYDDDGRADLLVTNDFGLKNLYRNEGGAAFRDVADRAGVEDRAYGMSAAWADFDGDGRLDLYATGCDTQWYFLHEYPALPIPIPGRVFLPIAIAWMEEMSQGNSLFLQRRPGAFDDATLQSGAAQAGWNWTVVAADLDNDSWPDLYAANGMWGDGRRKDRELEFWWDSLAYWEDYVDGNRAFDMRGDAVQGMERDRFFRNRGADGGSGTRFEERAFLDGLDLESNGRAAVAFDANGDGALDLYVRSVQAPEALYLGSRRPGEHFLRLRLVGQPGVDNREGVGARITAVLPDGRRVVQENGNASGFLSTGSPIAHIGLGGATRLESLTIRWPSGRAQEIGPVGQVDRTLTVDQARGLRALP
ncbi:MAG: CRTAC1 family protein [Thermoanaerobaculia bacterium]